ncbi:D-aminoacyl-tRNA deacylase [Alkalibacillus haloalkaliphilus]|uniref:D-aminoacyl-tRNA deacylase n=1 Tax=Alkalibacillus haloalkaliphilus TaxID=94136 RepID=A0A511W5R9_9BACI|nr:D-aminoacyl-tRNA deacylase [Alkalibacillus haloalkaliphilus]GEN46440.1 D-aminoacyl-tRNA deacylase [Alkalibacillus haloalkaliphilus]
MRAVIQRVTTGSVEANDEMTGSIELGLVVLLGVTHEDDEQDLKYIADKVTNLRIFEDEQGKLNLSVKDVGGKVLSISQFTLYGDCRKGRRPNFMSAAKPDQANDLYEKFNEEVANLGVPVETGAFGEHMKVSLLNDGPVTLILDSKDK